jgi:hypothetical protein
MPVSSCSCERRGPRRGGGEPPGVGAALPHCLSSPPAPGLGHVAAQGAPAEGVLRSAEHSNTRYSTSHIHTRL